MKPKPPTVIIMKPQAANRCLSILLILSFFSVFISFAQHQEEYGFSCGTEADPDSLVYDLFYGNNQKLIDIILEENISIPEGYFEYLGIEQPIEKSKSAALPGKKYVPIKLYSRQDLKNTEYNINTTEYSTGIYMITLVSTTGNTLTKRLIIKK